jgi:hypothetical protein
MGEYFMKIECKICGREFKNYLGLMPHLYHIHKITTKEYYLKYLGEQHYCYCGKETKFITMSKGFRTFCSTKCLANCKEIREKRKQTCRKKYGGDSPSHNIEVKEKKRLTNLKHRGVEHPSQSKEVKEKKKETCQKNFGVENPAQSKIVQERIKQTNLERFGKEFSLQNKEVKEKSKQTCLKIYTENAINVYSELGFEIISEYKHNRFLTLFKCKNCGFEFKEIPYNLYQRVHKCPVCDPYDASHFEKEVKEEIINYLYNIFNKNFESIYNDRTILNGKEIDLLIPELNLSIEINGDYWHSLEGIPERDKWKAEVLTSKGFKHFVIKECDWKNNKQSVFQKLDQIIKIDFETYLKNKDNFISI